MKNKSVLELLFLMMILSSCGSNKIVKNIHQDNSFREIGNLSNARFGHALVSSNNEIFIIGGIEKSNELFSTSIERFNINSNILEKLPTPILGRRYLGAVLVDSNIYIVGGEKKPGDLPLNPAVIVQTTGILEKYDLKTNRIIKLSEMPNPRKGMGIVEHNGKIYVIGGSQYKSLTKDKYGLKPILRIENPFYIYEDMEKQFLYLSSMDIYDIKTDTWTTGPSMNKARECKAVLHKNKIYVVGGYNGRPLDNIEIYDIENETWEELEDSPVSISAYSCLVKDDLIYFFGDYEELNMVLIFNPENKEWINIESNVKGCRHNASVTCNDEIFIVGGIVTPNIDTALDNIQQYNGL